MSFITASMRSATANAKGWLAASARPREPAQRHGPLGERVLQPRRLGVLEDLLPARLADVFSELRDDHEISSDGRCPDAWRTALITSLMPRSSIPVKASRRFTGRP